MSHFAKLDENNIVTFVIKAPQDSDGREDEFTQTTGEVWKQTSYNTRGGVHYNPETGEPSADQSRALRGNYAGLGYKYLEDEDVFVAPQPFPSWVLDENYLWQAPVAYPEGGGHYTWNEESQTWEPVVSEI